MASKKKPTDNDNLKGGTQHGNAARQMVPGSPSGGTNTFGSRRGASRPDQNNIAPEDRAPDQRGDYTDARLDAEDAFEGGSRHLSEAVAKQKAQDRG